MAVLSDVEKRILKTVIQRFLDSKKATRRKELLDAFESPGAIDSLVSTMILEQTAGNNYLPSAIAFHYCGDTEVEALTRRGVRAVAHVLKKLIKEEGPNLNPTNIETLAREFDSGINNTMVRVGLYVGRDLGLLQSSQGRNEQQADVIPVIVNEYIYEKDPERLWDDFIRQRDPLPQPAPAVTVNPAPPAKTEIRRLGDYRATWGRWSKRRVFGSHTGKKAPA